MGRLYFSEHVLFLSQLVTIWAAYRLLDSKSFPLRTMMTFPLLSSGITVTVENFDAILYVWLVSGLIWGGLML